MRYTNEKKTMELGELYRELRIARGLKLKDVTTDGLSLAQLSKFENGQTMLSADRLLMAIEGIHMTFAEFGHAVNDYQETVFLQLRNKIITLCGKQDIDGLKKLVEEYKDYESYGVYNRLNVLAIKDSIYSLDNTYVVEEEEIEFLTKYLYDIEEWTEYELYIFGSTMTLLSTEDLIFLGKAFIKRDKLYRTLTSNNTAAKTALLNLISVLVERDGFYYATYFIETLEKLLMFNDTLFITSLTFFKLIIDYKQSSDKDSQPLADYLASLETTGNKELADICRSTLLTVDIMSNN